MALTKFSPVFLVITGIAAFFMFLAVLFNIISLGSNNWYEIESVNIGLWKNCSHTAGCSKIDVADGVKAVRAFLLLSVLLVFPVAPLMVVGIALKRGPILFIAVLLTGVQGMMVAISMIIFYI